MIIDADGEKHFFSDYDLKIHSRGEKGNRVSFTSRTDLEFWFDADEKSALTNDPNVYLYMYNESWLGSIDMAFILHVNGRSIAFADKAPDARFKGWFFHYPYAQENKDGGKYLEIGSVGAQLSHKDRTVARQSHPLTNAEKFESQAYQEFAITLVEDILSRVSSSASRVARVTKREHAKVIWADEVQKKLFNGDLIEGAE